MYLSTFFEWLLAVIGSGGLGAIITYIATFKSKKKQAESLAELYEIEVQQKKLDLKLNLCDYLLNTLDKYIKDYHELEKDFRKQLLQLREQIDKISLEKSQIISTKCNEIAALKSKVTYLNGLRCYNFVCLKRIKENPDKNFK